jgi:hypothetical protein
MYTDFMRIFKPETLELQEIPVWHTNLHPLSAANVNSSNQLVKKVVIMLNMSTACVQINLVIIQESCSTCIKCKVRDDGAS